MRRCAVSLPPSTDANALRTMVSGMMAVSELDASATERSKPTTFWNRLIRRSTNSGRSQKVRVRTTRSRRRDRSRSSSSSVAMPQTYRPGEALRPHPDGRIAAGLEDLDPILAAVHRPPERYTPRPHDQRP
jgi:hypothetical protein